MNFRTRGPGGASSPPDPPAGDLSCEEALARVYEYLDGELGPELHDRIGAHLEVCRRCYPFFDFERMFLDYVREKGRSAPASEDLRERISSVLAASCE